MVAYVGRCFYHRHEFTRCTSSWFVGPETFSVVIPACFSRLTGHQRDLKCFVRHGAQSTIKRAPCQEKNRWILPFIYIELNFLHPPMRNLAEGEGLEPPRPFGLPVFKTGAFTNSAILPKESCTHGSALTIIRINRWYSAFLVPVSKDRFSYESFINCPLGVKLRGPHDSR